MVVPHGRGQPPGDHQSLRGSIGRQRRSEQGLQAGPVRALPEPLDLGTDREAAGVEPEVQRVPQPKPLGDLRQLRAQPEPPSREGLDVALFQVCPIDLAAAAKLPENRLQRQHQVLGLRVLPARDINPTLADRLAQPFHARGITTGLVLDRQSRRQEGDRHMRIERTGQHAPWHRGVEQAEIHEIRIDRVEPLPGLGQNLEAGTQPVDGRRSVATLPGIGAGENLAGQGLVVDRALMSHRGGQVAEQPVGRAQRQEVEGDGNHRRIIGCLGRADRAQTLLDLTDQCRAVRSRLEQDRAGILDLGTVPGREAVQCPGRDRADFFRCRSRGCLDRFDYGQLRRLGQQGGMPQSRGSAPSRLSQNVVQAGGRLLAVMGDQGDQPPSTARSQRFGFINEIRLRLECLPRAFDLTNSAVRVITTETNWLVRLIDGRGFHRRGRRGGERGLDVLGSEGGHAHAIRLRAQT